MASAAHPSLRRRTAAHSNRAALTTDASRDLCASHLSPPQVLNNHHNTKKELRKKYTHMKLNPHIEGTSINFPACNNAKNITAIKFSCPSNRANSNVDGAVASNQTATRSPAKSGRNYRFVVIEKIFSQFTGEDIRNMLLLQRAVHESSCCQLE